MMGLGVWFSEDLAHILRGVGESVSTLVAQRGLNTETDAAYVAGYYAALRAVATSLGIPEAVAPVNNYQIREIVTLIHEG